MNECEFDSGGLKQIGLAYVERTLLSAAFDLDRVELCSCGRRHSVEPLYLLLIRIRARLQALRINSAERLLLGGAALQRCDRSFDLNIGFSRRGKAQPRTRSTAKTLGLALRHTQSNALQSS